MPRGMQDTRQSACWPIESLIASLKLAIARCTLSCTSKSSIIPLCVVELGDRLDCYPLFSSPPNVGDELRIRATARLAALVHILPISLLRPCIIFGYSFGLLPAGEGVMDGGTCKGSSAIFLPFVSLDFLWLLAWNHPMARLLVGFLPFCRPDSSTIR